MPKAYSYVRFSRPEQLRGDSLRRQREKAEEWAAKKGLVIDESLVDLGVSAYRGANRVKGALGRFLKLVEAGKVERGSTLIIESLDRFSREKVRTVLPAFLDLVNAGVTVVTLADKQVYSAEKIDKEPFALFGSMMVMIRANEESATKSQRIGDAWKEKRRKNDVLTARVPAWLKVEVIDGKRAFVENGDRWRIVRRIFQETIAGYGRRQIADRLKGEPTFGGGTRWQPSYIAKILENRAVIGELQSHTRNERGERVPAGGPRANYYPVIVDEATFLRANSAKAARASAAGKRGEGVSNVLQGLTRCGVCGQRMVRVNKGSGPKGGKPFLICTGALAEDCGNTRRWKVDWVERRVMQGAIRVDLSKALTADDAPPAGPTVEDLALKRASLVKKRKTLLALVEDEDEGALERYRELAAEIEGLDAEIVRRRSEDRKIKGSGTAEERRLRMAEILARLDAANDAERTELRMRLAQELRSALSSVRFYKGEIGVVYKEGPLAKGAVLRKPAYLAVFRDHDEWKEDLRESDPQVVDPVQKAKDDEWLASLRKRADK